MRCPNCGYKEDFVVDSRATSQGSAIRRRRECVKCGKRFTTYEYIEEVSLVVVKKDGRREPFDRKKILSGIMKACEKRPISVEKMEELVVHIEHAIQRKSDREITSRHIGELVIEKLKKIDDVAYVRFASVYRQFKDIGQFIKELEGIIGTQKPLLKPRAKNKKVRK